MEVKTAGLAGGSRSIDVTLDVVPAVVADQEEVLVVPLPEVARVVLVARVVRDSVVSDTALQICIRRVSVSALPVP